LTHRQVPSIYRAENAALELERRGYYVYVE